VGVTEPDFGRLASPHHILPHRSWRGKANEHMYSYKCIESNPLFK
jgi:hypothetical protein